MSPFESLFEGSDGRYFTGWQLERRLRTGVWSLCIRQRAPNRVLIETEAGALLLLTPIEPSGLPAGIEIRVFENSARIADTRVRPSSMASIVPTADSDRSDPAPHEG
ncbi:hypothetical protein [Natrinema sp. SYSU A 869]|uniref:hypothetical protein n=1 Tax=Natrinema sp. SYSU A 869 TaxID=2871694 RepID=UPI001CA3EBC8|nr:hypothetical protein [Natrinema sp. SYSU A 869]